MRQGGWARVVVLAVAAMAAAGLTGISLPAAAASPGTLSGFAGGLGFGRATNVAQVPLGLAARAGRLVSVEGTLSPPSFGPMPGLVRSLDLASGTQTVLAGLATGGYRGDRGPATSAQLSRPTDAAIDSAGNVYITDTDNARVRKVTPGGTITTFAGNGVPGFSGEGAAASSASLKLPGGIAVAPSGDVVFADRGNYRLRKVSPGGIITTIAGTGERIGPAGDGGAALAAAIEPWAVAFDATGNLYFTDAAHGTLRKILVNGTITTVAAPALSLPALAVDAAGNVYGNSSAGVVRIGPAGDVTTVAGRPGPPPAGAPTGDGGPATDAYLGAVHDLAIDGGNLYLSQGRDFRIRRVDQAGVITTVAGNGRSDYGGDGGQALGAQFRAVTIVRSGPTGTYVASPADGDIRRIDPSGVVSTIYTGGLSGLAVNDVGTVFISLNHQVRRLDPSGGSSVVAGTGQAGFSGDGGPAALARLSWPTALAVDGVGNVYIADAGNSRIRRVNPVGTVTTYAGGGPPPERHVSLMFAADAVVASIVDLAVGSNGTLIWSESDPYFVHVRKVVCGIVSPVARTTGSIGGNLAVDAGGSVFHTTATEVRRTDPSGAVSTVAGSGGSLIVDGVAATSARLSYPGSLAVHPSGRLLLGHENRVLQVEGVSAGRAVSAGPCETLPDRPVWGTGYNLTGQVGDGTTIDRATVPGDNPVLTGATGVSGGLLHSLAVRTDGTVWAWGWNAYGQLGDGTMTDRLRPVPVAGLTGVVAVAAGAFHSLALQANGTVWAWGWSPFGQVGDGTTTQRMRPVPVLEGATAISAGLFHSLAARSDGSVAAWGYNGLGQLGDGTLTDRWAPTRLRGIAGATGVGAGAYHSLAVKADGSAWGWGWNHFGQLGDGTVAPRHVPTPVAGLTGAKAVSAGWHHSMALKRDGSVASWGLGHAGQLGNNTTNSSLIPVTTPFVAGAVAISGGAYHSLVLLGDGQVMGWGWNYFGQLAPLADFDSVLSPEHPHVLGKASAVGAGGFHSLFAHRFGVAPA